MRRCVLWSIFARPQLTYTAASIGVKSRVDAGSVQGDLCK